jgi:hypothetical protein
VAAYNRERGTKNARPLRIGIHTGELMIGTVG